MKEDPSNNKMKGLDQKKLVLELSSTQGLSGSVKASLCNDSEKDKPDRCSDVNSGKFDELQMGQFLNGMCKLCLLEVASNAGAASDNSA